MICKICENCELKEECIELEEEYGNFVTCYSYVDCRNCHRVYEWCPRDIIEYEVNYT